MYDITYELRDEWTTGDERAADRDLALMFGETDYLHLARPRSAWLPGWMRVEYTRLTPRLEDAPLRWAS